MSQADRERSTERIPLSRERVLLGAIAVADAGGTGSLTIRSLAQHLGVKPMSLYYYVSGKDEIVDGIVDLVFSEIDLPAPDGDWRTGDGAARKVGPSSAAAATPGRSRCCSRGPLLARRRCATTTRSSAACGEPASR